ncbi:NADP-dependent oxidoreductase [Sphingobium sp. EM0848]|uniref:NADP-dependent oxidoreductase n=1 Tax=Sphingobium sp. EM0848 TaxID=2743473 RepID=UPI00159C5C70|nr:NADP-dependent oxidoreductase [Sphingobium sp. EM0848]
MKIIRAHEFGGPDRLVIDEVDQQEPGPGQIRLRVQGIGVNPVDWKLLSGKAPVLPPLPLVPGGDVAGIVDAVGDGVEGWSEGDPVFAHPGLMGGYAESILVDAAACAVSPKGLRAREAASLPLVALTAWQGLLADGRDLSGLHVLVHNAAGGVGTVAVQIVKAKGGRVSGTASTANAAYVRSLGADDVVDFRSEPVEGRAQDVDILLDLVGNSQESGLWSLVKPGGSVIRIAGGPKAPDVEEVDGVRAYKVRVRPNGGQLREIAVLVEQGALKVEIAATYPFPQAADALRASMAGHIRGKIVLAVD